MAGPNLSTTRTTADSATDHVADHNTAHAVLNRFDTATPVTGQVLTWNGSTWASAVPVGSFLELRVFSVRAYGAVGNGVANDTTAVANAAAAMVAAGSGVLWFPPGTYKVTSLPSLTPVFATAGLPYAVRGAGSGVTIINHQGTSAASSLTVSNPAFDPNQGSTGAPMWGGFTLDGTGSSGGVCGIRWGDISWGTWEDIICINFGSGDGVAMTNGYGWCEGMTWVAVRCRYNARQVSFDVGSGKVLGTITTTLTNGQANITAIAVSGGMSEATYVGQNLVIAVSTSAVGVYTQTVVVTTATAAGAVSIPVQAFTAGAAFPAGTAKVHFGGFGSYDYWSTVSCHIEGLANQHGIVSERSRGIGERIDRLGSTLNFKGNFRAAAGNTGIVIWLKGRDRFNDTQWNFTVETGGGQPTHKSIQLDNTEASIGGVGVLSFYGCQQPTMQAYQWEFGGEGAFAASFVSANPDPTKFLRFYEPGHRNTTRGVTPSGYPATAPTNGTPYLNPTDYDLLVTVPVTFTGTGTASFAIGTYAIPAAAASVAAGPAGMKVPLTFVHYANCYARIDVQNGTIGAPTIGYV